MNDKEQIAKDLGSTIRKYRNKACLSQKALGDAIGVSHSTISRYERGLSDIPISKLTEISEICQFPLREYIWAFMTDSDMQVVLKRLMDKLNLDYEDKLGMQHPGNKMYFATYLHPSELLGHFRLKKYHQKQSRYCWHWIS